MISYQRQKGSEGFVLIFVLWVIVILTALAIGLGRKTAVELSLVNYSITKWKTNHLAWAGFMYAIDQIVQDTRDAVTRNFDTLYQCGVKIPDGKSPQDIFKEISLGVGHFDIGYPYHQDSGGNGAFIYGLEDEERKININALNYQNRDVLAQLLIIEGVDVTLADSIARAVVDWKDSDSQPLNPSDNTEDEYYMSLPYPYHCKNAPLDSIEELLLVKGMTSEISQKIKDFITIYPRGTTQLSINFDTAPDVVLRALARSLTGAATQTDIPDAESLVVKMMTYRRGKDNQEGTSDDQRLELDPLTLNASEKALFLSLTPYRTFISNFFRVKVRGYGPDSTVTSEAEAVVGRQDLSILYWHRQ